MYISLNGLQVFYQKTGKGKDLILLHGWGNDSSSFWPIIEPLKNEFTLWLLDLPGHGKSDSLKEGWTVTDYASLVKDFIKEQDIKSPNIFGHSLGGRIGIKLAARNGKVIDKLILESSAGIKPRKNTLSVIYLVIAKFIKYILPDAFNLKSKLRHRFYQNVGSDYEKVGNMKQTFINIINEDLTPDLKEIENETLLIWGENDKTVPRVDAKKMYRQIPNSKLVILEEAGHFPHLEQSEKVVYYVKDFI